MESGSKFYVMTSGKILPGFNMEDVEGRVAALFKVSRQKARAILTQKKLIKKIQDAEFAILYREKLEGLGVAIQLLELRPVPGGASSHAANDVPDEIPELEESPRRNTEINAPSPIESSDAGDDGESLGLIKTTNKLPDFPLILGPGAEDITKAPEKARQNSGRASKKAAKPRRGRAKKRAAAEKGKVDQAVALALKPTGKENKSAPAAPAPTVRSPTASSSIADLALEPIRKASDEDPNVRIACPKCGLEQPKSDKCKGCGVYVHKIQDSPGVQDFALQEPAPEFTSEIVEEEKSGWLALLLAAAVAAGGAYVWRTVALTTGYEIGWVASLIGAAIGVAAAIAGSTSQRIGIACGVLAFLAILGGKFLTYQAILSDVELMLGQIGEEAQFQRLLYDQLIYEAEILRDMSQDEASLRGFMVDHGYSDAYQPEEVTALELAYFESDVLPELNTLMYAPPPFETWLRTTFEAEVADVSSMSLLVDSLVLTDLLFLFLGIGAAARIGSGMTRKS